jgi:hypothetical protein
MRRLLLSLTAAGCLLDASGLAAQTPPTLQSVVSRKVHGAAGAFDLLLSTSTSNPTTEPRMGQAQTVVFRFNKAVTAGTALVTEGTATAGVPNFSGVEMIVPLTGVVDQQYVTVSVSNVASSDAGTGGVGTVRLGFLTGDVNQSGVATIADLGLVNAQLAQPLVPANVLKDVNASGTLTVADKGLTNTNLTKSLPSPNAGWTALISRSWTLAAGQEAYLCRGAVAPQDLYITAFRAPTIPGLARVFVTVSDTAQTLGDFACTAGEGLSGATKLIYWAGPGVNDTQFPAGKGVVVKAGQYVLLNTHLDNGTGIASLSGTTQLLMKTGTATQVTTPVEMILVGTFNINIPPNSTHTAAGGCALAIDQTFLSLAPGMRRLAIHQLVQVTGPPGPVTTTLLDRDFDVTQQLAHAMSPPTSLHAGDQLRTTCTYTNTTGATVGFGDSVQSEVCFTGVYRFPVVAGNEIFSCTN